MGRPTLLLTALACVTLASACNRTASGTEEETNVCEGFVARHNECADSDAAPYDLADCEDERASHAESWPECDADLDAFMVCMASATCEDWDALVPVDEAPQGTPCLAESVDLSDCTGT